MIGKITGVVDHVGEDHALIEAGGVGYVVYCGAGTLAALPAPGAVASLYTELVVREDLMQLFGFRTLAEREWHRLLTSVQGVGAKVSLGVLGALGAEGVARAVAAGDANAIRTAPGVGPKLAQRIVRELAGKAPDGLAFGTRAAAPRGAVAPPPVPAAVPAGSAPEPAADAAADAVSALVNLGYDRGEAARAVAAAGQDAGGAEAQDLIRAALRALGPSL